MEAKVVHHDKLITQEQRTQDNQLHSPFLRLPAELRNKIYNLAFEGKRVQIRQRSSYRPPNKIILKYQGTIGLLFTCRQIRYEALPLFYTHCTFSFSVESFNHTTLRELSQETRSSIQTIKLSTRTLERRRFTVAWFGGLLPALRHVHFVGWGFNRPMEYIVEVTQRTFGKDDIEVHVSY